MNAEQMHGMTVGDVVKLAKSQMLRANPEYQRGVVWKADRKKKLIDSLLRGYPLPLIYLHHITSKVGKFQNDALEVIDGQQRINALFEFHEGAFKLFDPVKDDREAKFPRFVKEQPCPWAGKDFAGLSEELKARFLSTPLSVFQIETEDPNEVRDLFVRLQAGLPLNAQETRDALPGQFTEFVLKLGGKPEIPRYPGHPFFSEVLGLKPNLDRGKTRQLAAQICMIFMNCGKQQRPIPDINTGGIDQFYFTNIDFDAQDERAKRLVNILDKLHELLRDGKRPKLHAHDAIHLVLLTDLLWDDYVRSWEEKLPSALDKFLAQLAKAKQTKNSDAPDPYWLKYGVWTRTNSDRGETIRSRHDFYLERMFEFLAPLQVKDPKRLYGPLERELIYFRSAKKCGVCGSSVTWNDAEIHHKTEHQHGGKTDFENAVLVHRACHPKGAAAIAFAESSSS